MWEKVKGEYFLKACKRIPLCCYTNKPLSVFWLPLMVYDANGMLGNEIAQQQFICGNVPCLALSLLLVLPTFKTGNLVQYTVLCQQLSICI
jgi:hypothetical protein